VPKYLLCQTIILIMALVCLENHQFLKISRFSVSELLHLILLTAPLTVLVFSVNQLQVKINLYLDLIQLLRIINYLKQNSFCLNKKIQLSYKSLHKSSQYSPETLCLDNQHPTKKKKRSQMLRLKLNSQRFWVVRQHLFFRKVILNPSYLVARLHSHNHNLR